MSTAEVYVPPLDPPRLLLPDPRTGAHPEARGPCVSRGRLRALLAGLVHGRAAAFQAEGLIPLTLQKNFNIVVCLYNKYIYTSL